jgi:hypothetical protein
MTRVFSVAVLLTALPAGSLAGENGVHLTVRPMAAPKPALKYPLLPEVREMHPGNPAQWYVRCFQEQRNFFFSKEGVAERARYLAMPLAQLPRELREYGRSPLNQAEWGARLDALDWQVLERVQNEGLDLMLPELGPLRVLGLALQVRFRGRLGGRHYDDAARSAATMFSLARHLGEYPAAAAAGVGLEVADRALDTLEEMVQLPDAPNLYWSLTDLPDPLVDLHKGVQGDRALVAIEFRLLRNDVPMTAAEIEQLVSHLSGKIGFAREQAGERPQSFRARLQARVRDAHQVRAARRRLIEAYCTDHRADPAMSGPVAVASFVGESFQKVHRIDQFPPEQVILLDEKRAYDVRRDDDMKLLSLAPWQIEAVRGADSNGGAVANEDGLFADLLPRVLPARQAQAQFEQRIALLRCVEALRMYAASHDGKLPTRLADVSVPLPVDPFTGKSFEYEVKGGAASLRGRPPQNAAKGAACKSSYEITLSN